MTPQKRLALFFEPDSGHGVAFELIGKFHKSSIESSKGSKVRVWDQLRLNLRHKTFTVLIVHLLLELLYTA